MGTYVQQVNFLRDEDQDPEQKKGLVLQIDEST